MKALGTGWRRGVDRWGNCKWCGRRADVRHWRFTGRGGENAQQLGVKRVAAQDHNTESQALAQVISRLEVQVKVEEKHKRNYTEYTESTEREEKTSAEMRSRGRGRRCSRTGKKILPAPGNSRWFIEIKTSRKCWRDDCLFTGSQVVAGRRESGRVLAAAGSRRGGG